MYDEKCSVFVPISRQVIDDTLQWLTVRRAIVHTPFTGRVPSLSMLDQSVRQMTTDFSIVNFAPTNTAQRVI